MYLTYEEYQTMGGTLDETSFNDFEMEAETIVDWYTFNRLQNDTEYPEKLKRCMYQLIKLAEEKQSIMSPGESAEGGETNASVASRSNDGVSISYNVMSAKDIYETIKTDSAQLVQRYLNGVMNQLGRKVLYKGLYPGE